MMGGVRVGFTALICLLAFLNVGVWGFDLSSRQLTVSDIPACGITCLLLKVPNSGCGFNDVECQCQNKELNRQVSACMLANCTMEDSLDTAKVQADLCHYSDESQTRDVYLYTSIVYSIALMFVVLRIIGKIASKRIAIDDYIIIVAMLLTTIPLGVVLKMAGSGFGKHLWNLEHGQLREALLLFLVAWSTYILVLALIKVSLVMFYLEIFPQRSFRIASWTFLGFLVVNTLILYFLTLFNCVPVRAFWNRDVKGRCLDINALAYATSGSAITQDVILLILPLVSIRKLNMKLYRKIAVGFMFSIGTFGCIASILRLRSLLSFKASIDPTWDYVPVTVWTELELAAAFACVSLPSIRLLFMMLIPKSVKEFLSHISHYSRSSSTPTPNKNSQNTNSSAGRREPTNTAWKPFTQDIGGSVRDLGESVRGSRSLGSGLWPNGSRSHLRSQSHRLSSTSGSHPQDLEPDSSPVNSGPEKHEHYELQEISSPSSSRRFCRSCCEQPDTITALPPFEHPGDVPAIAEQLEETPRSLSISERIWEARPFHAKHKGDYVGT